MKKQIMYLVTALIVTANTGTYAQDNNPATACREAATLFDEGSLTEALEEAKWCVESMQQVKQNATASVFPDEINGFKGGEVKSQNSFGIRLIERFYSSETERIEVKFTAGAGGGLAALANLGLTMGGAGKKLRINRYKVLDLSTPQNVHFVVTMKAGGGSLDVSTTTASYETAMKFLKKIPFKKIDEATGS